MQIQINIQDCTMQEARQMLEMLGWCTPTVLAPVEGGIDEKALKEAIEKAEEEKPEPPIPDHLPLGQAVAAAKKINAKRAKAIVATHKSGEIKYFETVSEASGHCGVSSTYIYAIVGKGKETQNGWKFEYDNGR